MWLANNRILVILESQFGGWFWLGGTYFAFWVRTKGLFRPLKKFDKFAMALLCSLNAFQTKHLTKPRPWIIKKCLRVLNSTFSYWLMYKNCIMMNFLSHHFHIEIQASFERIRFRFKSHACGWSLWRPWARLVSFFPSPSSL